MIQAEMTQAEIFLDGGGDGYYLRNKNDFGAGKDPVQELIEAYGGKPTRVLEVGCANGWRLAQLREKYGCEVAGIDPSALAVAAGNARLGNGRECLVVGTAQALPWPALSFDLVIHGFCLWLCSPDTWFQIAAETDRVLIERGGVIIHDFLPPRPLIWPKWAPATASAEERQTDAWFYDFSKLWLGHPGYRLVAENIIGRQFGKVMREQSACLLVKCYEASFLRLVAEDGAD